MVFGASSFYQNYHLILWLSEYDNHVFLYCFSTPCILFKSISFAMRQFQMYEQYTVEVQINVEVFELKNNEIGLLNEELM